MESATPWIMHATTRLSPARQDETFQHHRQIHASTIFGKTQGGRINGGKGLTMGGI